MRPSLGVTKLSNQLKKLYSLRAFSAFSTSFVDAPDLFAYFHAFFSSSIIFFQRCKKHRRLFPYKVKAKLLVLINFGCFFYLFSCFYVPNFIKKYEIWPDEKDFHLKQVKVSTPNVGKFRGSPLPEGLLHMFSLKIIRIYQ